MQDIQLINTFPFFKAGMQSHLSLPPAKKQPDGVSALGSTRLTSSPDKALRLRDGWSSWILLCNLAPPQVTRGASVLPCTSSAEAELNTMRGANLHPRLPVGTCEAAPCPWDRACICTTTWCACRGCSFAGHEADKHEWRVQCKTLVPRALPWSLSLGRCSQTTMLSQACEMKQADFTNCSWASFQFLCYSALTGVRPCTDKPPVQLWVP